MWTIHLHVISYNNETVFRELLLSYGTVPEELFSNSTDPMKLNITQIQAIDAANVNTGSENESKGGIKLY